MESYASYYGFFGVLVVVILMMICGIIARRRHIERRKTGALSTPVVDAAFDGRLPQSVHSYPTPPKPPPAAMYGRQSFYQSPSSPYHSPGASTEEVNIPFADYEPPAYQHSMPSPRRSPQQFM